MEAELHISVAGHRAVGDLGQLGELLVAKTARVEEGCVEELQLLLGDHSRAAASKEVLRAPCAENAKINVTDEPYFGTYILCSYLPLSNAAKGAQGGPQQYKTFERKHSPTDISKRLWSSEK